MSAGQKIAILEDMLEIQRMIETALQEAGYEVRAFGRASDFERALEDWAPDLAIIDLGLPDKDGLGVLRSVSGRKGTAILVVSARAGLSDKIAGLELGADDYLTKPFEMSELIARVRALIRRKSTKASTESADEIYAFSGLTVDLNRFVLTTAAGAPLRLSVGEAALLRIFLQHPNRLVTRDRLRAELSDRSDEISFDRTIDVRISRLRAKLSDSTKDPKIIQTIYGAGYILIADVRTG